MQFLLELVNNLALPKLLRILCLIRGEVYFERAKRRWPLKIEQMVFSLARVCPLPILKVLFKWISRLMLIALIHL